MAAVELILMQRVEKLGQMGDVVRVKPGYARNFLLPQKMATRANKANREQFEQQRVQLEAQNLRRREEAERLAERIGRLSVVIIRQASDSGSLYGSVSGRDIAEGCTAGGLTITRTRSSWNTRSSRWACPACASCCTRRSRSPSPPTWPAARRKPRSRPAASGSARMPRKRTPRLPRRSRRCSTRRRTGHAAVA